MTDGIILPPDSKAIPLSKGKFAIVDDEDYDFLMGWKWFFSGYYATRTKVLSYTNRKQKKASVYMHRVILGTPVGMQTDHINGEKLDNRKCNLRIATRSQNNMNQRKTRGTSKYKGVFWLTSHEKWQASIWINGKVRYIKIFDSEADAARAYNNAALKYFGEFACINIIE